VCVNNNNNVVVVVVVVVVVLFLGIQNDTFRRDSNDCRSDLNSLDRRPPYTKSKSRRRAHRTDDALFRASVSSIHPSLAVRDAASCVK
jgi:hypothetical protein